MNNISILGRITKDAELILVTSLNGETPLAVFTLSDLGLPFQTNEPLSIEIHYLKEPASIIANRFKRGNEVFVIGTLKTKKFISHGLEKRKYYVQAENIMFTSTSKGVK